jgi:ABC-type antimicrobial peptide transport system permease subunit
VIATVGVAGVLAFSVSQRTNELGIRVALGAERGTILRMILGEGAAMALIGLAVGGAAACRCRAS